LVAVLGLIGGAFALIGSVGLVRLGSFYDRVHAPTLGTTLATALISFAALIHSFTLANGPALSVLLIVVAITLSTPVSLITVVRAAVFRDRHEGSVLQRPDRANRS
jgi:multicomponent K+:H+ antiporter subunit G